jgi:hypothetical protein
MRTFIELRGFGFQIAYTVLESGRAGAKIDGCIPITAAWHHNSRRKHLKMPPVIIVGPTVLEALEVSVAHHPHVALVRALNDDNIAGIKVFARVHETHGRLLNEG